MPARAKDDDKPVSSANFTITYLTRHENTVEQLYKQYLSGQTLSPGKLTKILHRLSPQEQKKIKLIIKKGKDDFWKKWKTFRLTPPGQKEPNFEDIITMLPVREEFVEFIKPQKKTLIVELDLRPASMAGYFDNIDNLAGYLAIADEKSKKTHKFDGLKNFSMVKRDLNNTLPKIDKYINKFKPKSIKLISNWMITYYDANTFIHLIEQTFSPVFNQGLPTTVDFNMITQGQFDPQILKSLFVREIIPMKLFKLQISSLLRAKKAIPKMLEFSKDFREIMPLWFPDEITELLSEKSFQVSEVDSSLMWGQSTAIKVTGKV